MRNLFEIPSPATVMRPNPLLLRTGHQHRASSIAGAGPPQTTTLDLARYAMTYYIDLFSPETYEAFTRSTQGLSGFRMRHKGMAERIKAGDVFACYVTRVSRWCGLLEIIEGPFIDNSPIFVPEDDPFVVRFKVRPKVWLPIDQSLPIHPGRGRVTVALRAFRQAAFRRQRRVVILRVIHAPLELAILHGKTPQLAVAGLRINAVAIHQRGATRSRRSLTILECPVQGRMPQLRARVLVEGVKDFHVRLRIEIKHLVARDDRSGMALAHLELPDPARLARQGLRNPAAWRNMTITQRPAPAGPIRGETMMGQDHRQPHPSSTTRPSPEGGESYPWAVLKTSGL